MEMNEALALLKSQIREIESKALLMQSKDSSILNDCLRSFIALNQSKMKTSEKSQAILYLPTDMQMEICLHMDFATLFEFSLVNRSMRDFVSKVMMPKLVKQFGSFVTIGNQIDALDKKGVWLSAQVIKSSFIDVQVHYLGFNSRWDETIPRDSANLAPLRSHSVLKAPAPVRCHRSIQALAPPMQTITLTGMEHASPEPFSSPHQGRPLWARFDRSPSVSSSDTSPTSEAASSDMILAPLQLPGPEIVRPTMFNFLPNAVSSSVPRGRPIFAAAKPFVPKK